MNEPISPRALGAITIGLVASIVIAVSNQLAAEEPNGTTSGQIILSHPGDKIGIAEEKKILQKAAEENKTEGNILKPKGSVPEEVIIGPVHNDQWPREAPAN